MFQINWKNYRKFSGLKAGLFNAVFVLLLFAFSASTKGEVYEKLKDGILLELNKQKDTDASILRVQVLSEDIFRVTAAPGKTFSERPSLMVNKRDWLPVEWRVKEEDGYISLMTSKVTAKINQTTGQLSFYDSDGNQILTEKSNGKIISEADVLGEKTYHIQQLFDSQDGDAYYGLGAHQNGVMNYKGHDVDLWQYNIVDIIPFLVSSNAGGKHFGILWDNNSRTKFGDIRDYRSISELKIYNKDGKPEGITAEYFKDSLFSDLFASRTEPRIEHEYLDVNDAYPEGFAENVKAIRWSGEIEPDAAGEYKFQLYCSGYTKMWLNGELVVDSWRQNWLPWNHFIRLNMEPGKKYNFKIEWIHSNGFLGLRFLTPEDDIYKNSLSLYSEVADQIDYYFINGKNYDDIIGSYREITGKSPMMPKWAMGLWQSRERYKTQEELLDVVKEFRSRKIPIDNIVQDWHYWEEDKWGDHDFDPVRFPDPKGMIETLHNDLNTRIMISVWPKFYVGTENYELFTKKGWLYTRNVEKKQRDWVGPGYFSTFYDPYNDEARKVYWSGIDHKLFSLGIDAWWLDSVEPDLQSNLSRKETILRMGPTALGSASRYLNTYSLVNCEGVYNGQRQSDPDKRVFILTRSAFAGQQRYAAATWSGDVAARWHDLKMQVPAGLNFSLSGIPYWTTDVGGFSVEPRFESLSKESDVEEWRELNTRWFQFSTFCPLLRVHGQFPFREMFNIAPDDHIAYKTMFAYDKLRYRLMPYLYSMSGWVTNNNYTMMRALVMDFPDDKNVSEIGDQYMFGPAFLVNPVTDYKARSRKLYLPEGTGWYDLISGKYYEGGDNIEADAPYDYMPVFVREGAIVPCGPEIQYTDEKPGDPIRLFVYAGADGSFNLYEDEGINNNYEQGLFSIIPVTFNEENNELKIGSRKGEFPGMLKDRTFEIILISKDRAAGLEFESEPDVTVKYDGSEQTINLAGIK